MYSVCLRFAAVLCLVTVIVATRNPFEDDFIDGIIVFNRCTQASGWRSSKLSESAFKKCLKSEGIYSLQPEELFRRVDTDGSGYVDEKEFIAYYTEEVSQNKYVPTRLLIAFLVIVSTVVLVIYRNTFTRSVVDACNAVVTTASQLASVIWATISSITLSVVNNVHHVVVLTANKMRDVFLSVWYTLNIAIKSVLKLVYDVYSAALNGLSVACTSFLEALQFIWSGLKDIISGLVTVTQSFIVQIFEGIGYLFRVIVEYLSNLLNLIFEFVGNSANFVPRLARKLALPDKFTVFWFPITIIYWVLLLASVGIAEDIDLFSNWLPRDVETRLVFVTLTYLFLKYIELVLDMGFDVANERINTIC